MHLCSTANNLLVNINKRRSRLWKRQWPVFLAHGLSITMLNFRQLQGASPWPPQITLSYDLIMSFCWVWRAWCETDHFHFVFQTYICDSMSIVRRFDSPTLATANPSCLNDTVEPSDYRVDTIYAATKLCKSVKFSSGMEYKNAEISSASGGLPHPNYVKHWLMIFNKILVNYACIRCETYQFSLCFSTDMMQI
jgi:hypothetical protein